MRRRHAAAAALVWCAPAWSAQRGAHGSSVRSKAYGRRGDVLAAARSIAVEHALDTGWVEATLAQARFVPDVAQLIMPATTPAARNWAAYRARFIETRRIEAGARWWRDNHSWLDLADQRFGVPADIVVGIVGVETYYGRVSGSFRVLDALATLSFDFPSGRSDRSGFFRSELGHFLKLASREGWDAVAVLGSYAGAMGLPQFMPSSVINHAIDFDEDGRIDLATSSADAIGSVARFLHAHGWQRGMPTHYAVEPPTDIIQRALLLVPDIVPSFNPAQMVDSGARLDAAALQHGGSLALIELHNAEAAPSYVAGTQNFYALTRYNASSYYALAVIELGRAVALVR
ncbi:MAG TPA: lytic murein transglycosylase B [Burkholderiaceae bacterium]|nr:lytic murein transglycosylase B [Burkholderiaceae bacterium]